MVTSSSRYIRAGQKLGIDGRFSTRPHILVGLLDLIGQKVVDDLQFIRLFENPMLHYAVEACWNDVSVLMDAGVSLNDKSLPRLRFDVETAMHEAIVKLREADEAESEDRSAGDAEHINLLSVAEQHGYPASELLKRVIEKENISSRELAAGCR